MKYHYTYKSPVGFLDLVSDGSSLIALTFINNERGQGPERSLPEIDPIPQTVDQLERYFQGELQSFDLPIALCGTPFQIRAWNELLKIPFGETISYKDQAAKIGNVPRAVGLANGQNPIAIIVPCHRVVGASGKLVGYGGGLDRKRALLQFEAIVKDFGPQAFGNPGAAYGAGGFVRSS